MTSSLFQGIAVVIDDDLDIGTSEIAKIVAEIQNSGGYVVGLRDVPQESAELANFSGAAFFIVDWNLLGNDLGTGTDVPSELRADNASKVIGFLKRLRKRRHAPVFIFTTGSLDEVHAALGNDAELSYAFGQPTHILVMKKDEVISKGVHATLNEWAKQVPSAIVLRTWELEYERAKNAFFHDFYSKSVLWPAMLWKTYSDDGVPASPELGRLITRNLLSRMTPFEFDLSGCLPQIEELEKSDPTAYRSALLSVLNGERFVQESGLHADSVVPGDVFKDGERFFLNIRPDCDCVQRGSDPLQLYLLKGTVMPADKIKEKLNREFGLFQEQDNEAIVFAMHGEAPVSFKFKVLHQKKWSEMRTKRVGRLIPPFITRIQQRYATYLQRPGLPRIPKGALPPEDVRQNTGGEASTAGAADLPAVGPAS